ncbi:DUF1592 domain-containing protein [Croceicoccus hydrothermalis]|uniref:DUF1592 domain-containing protein n=1 Tax=Croceicoccus hydrothermalis TaxID=2867964 RepID=UPI001EFB5E47|nr:DUF1592 domain-containing protein [Croceicoccus hydrothermalis]
MRQYLSAFDATALLRDRKRVAMALVLGLLALVLIASGMGSGEPEPVGGPAMMRRLTEDQYRATIADIFADDIEIAARFERPVRADGLIAIGTGEAGMSPFAVEQYDAAAQSIAASVTSKKRRNQFMSCRPADPARFDEKCAREFLGQKGRMLFRRPLAPRELDRFVSIARTAHARLGGFYEGLELGLYTMLVSPDFLFRIERAEPGEGPTRQLDAFSKASRLSYFLTNSTPDDELLRAAEDGELNDSAGVERQVARLMESPRYRVAVTAFFRDMLQFDRFSDLSKDPEIFPAFNSDVADAAQEQTLRTIAEHLIDRDGDYRELFTTRDTFLNRDLGVIYRTPVAPRSEWQPVTFAKNAHRAGIQSHISFLALHSHPGRSSRHCADMRRAKFSCVSMCPILRPMSISALWNRTPMSRW